METRSRKIDKELTNAIGEKDFKIIKNLSFTEKTSLAKALPYLKLADHTHQCFWLGNKKHNTIYINKTYREISGYSLKEWIGRQCDFCFTEESKKTIEKHHKLRSKGLSSQYETDILSKTGKITTVLISGTPTEGGGTMGLFTNLQLSDKLSRNDQRLLNIVGYKDLKVVKKMVKPKDQNLIIKYGHSIKLANTIEHSFWMGNKHHKTIYANSAYQKLTEYPLKECIGQPSDFCFDKESKETIAKHHKFRQAGIASKYEASYITKNGKKVPILVIGAPAKTGGTYGFHIDLTEIKQLTKNKEINNQIIHNSIEAIAILDENYKIRLWNNGAVKMFGYKELEVLNKRICDFLVPEELQEENTDLIKKLEIKNIVRNFETKRLSKKGNTVDVSLSFTKVMSGKNLIGHIVIYQNITEKKQITSELQKRFEAIQDAYKELGLQKRQNDYMYEIIETATSEARLDNLTKLIVSAACMLTKCDGAVLRLYEKDINRLRLHACIGVGNKWLTKNSIFFENSIAEKAFKNKRSIIIQDIASSEKHQGIKLAKAHGFRTLILIPLMVNNKFLGSLSLYTTDPGKFRLIETDFLERFGKQCSIALFTKNPSLK